MMENLLREQLHFLSRGSLRSCFDTRPDQSNELEQCSKVQGGTGTFCRGICPFAALYTICLPMVDLFAAERK